MARRHIYLLLLAASILAVGFLCWNNYQPKPIIIGYSADITGRMSELGISGRTGVQTAVEIINENGGINGRPIRLLISDDKNSPQGALDADRKLVKNGAVAIIGHMVSGVMPLTLPFINSHNVLMISPTISDVRLSSIDDHFVRIIDTNAAQGRALADHAYALKCRKIAALYELKNHAYSEGVYSHFKKRFTELGGQIIMLQTYSANARTDFAKLAGRMVESKADGILSVTSGLDNALLCQQLSKMNYSVPVFAGMWASTKDLITHGGGSVSGMHLAGTFDKFNSSGPYLKFKASYAARFRKQPDFAAVYGYEAAMALFQVLKQSEKYDVTSLKQKLIRIKQFDGLQSDFRIDQYGDSIRPYQVFTVRNGEFVREE